MVIEIHDYDFEGFTVSVNGETLLECLSLEEVNNLTLGELDKLYQK